jgi:hypothetical protein
MTSIMPKRVQMTLNSPWRADNPEAIIVDRRTEWGNPFVVGGYYVEDEQGFPYPAPQYFHSRLTKLPVIDNAHAAMLFNDWIYDYNCAALGLRKRARNHLQGHDLACWCRPDQPCHADTLLEVANQ